MTGSVQRAAAPGIFVAAPHVGDQEVTQEVTHPTQTLRNTAPAQGQVATMPQHRLLVGLVGASLAVSAVLGGPLIARAGWTAGHTPPCRATVPIRTRPLQLPCPAPPLPLPLVRNLKAPTIRQDMSLDCESAALAVALETRGFDVSQDWVFGHLPKEERSAVLSEGRPVRWGDPNVAFVGNVNGSEASFTGYGVYEAPIAAVAEVAGAAAVGHTGWTAVEIEDEVRAGNPVVIWVNFGFSDSATRTWTAWDGQVIPYTTLEHAVTVVGVNMRTHTVTVVDVAMGARRTLTDAAFAAALRTFGGMAVAIEGAR